MQGWGEGDGNGVGVDSQARGERPADAEERRSEMCRRHGLVTLCYIALVLFLALCFPFAVQSGGGGKGKPSSDPPPSETPMTLEYDLYHFGALSGDNSCLGEDDWLEWKATGSLAPNESFTFIPQVPACTGTYAIFAALAWQGSTLRLSSTVPDDDYTSWDLSQADRPIVARLIGNHAQLCMFPSYDVLGLNYAITVTNVGTTTATNVVLEGGSDNDWSILYYHRCLQADADGDGWNDSFEHSIAKLLYPLYDGANPDVPYTLWGTNYLQAYTESGQADDEIDAYPPDFNDDGVVDINDIDRITSYVGSGNGVPLQDISPNASAGVAWYHNNHLSWRRYDLDADGYVTQADVDIVVRLADEAVPMGTDVVLPSARVMAPTTGEIVTHGSSYRIEGHAADNAALTRVDYLINDKIVCSQTTPIATFYYCWWTVPKKRGAYDITINAYDANGNVGSSETVTVAVQ